MDIFCENSQFNYLKHTLIENYNESILTEIILFYSCYVFKVFPGSIWTRKGTFRKFLMNYEPEKNF